MKINAGTMKRAMVISVMAIALFTLLPQIVPDVVDQVYNFTSEMALKTTSLGTAPAAFFTTLGSLQGWFWVIAALGLIFGIPAAIFAYGRKRR